LQISAYDTAPNVISSGQMVLIPKGIYMISDLIPECDHFEAMVFFFEEALIEQFIIQQKLPAQYVPHNNLAVLNQPKSLGFYMDALKQLYFETTASSQVTDIKLLELLYLLANSDQGADFMAAIQALGQRPRKSIVQFMNANYDKPLSIEDYAYLTGRSISTFSRDFKRQFGTPPKRWLIDKRLDKAKRILLEDGYTVTQTALEVGYENLSHFIKAFHKKHGVSPKQFMMQNRKELII
jgi:AraC-like DNA-binding protein